MEDLQSAIESIQKAELPENAFHEFRKIIRAYGYENAVFSLITDHPSIRQGAFHGLSTSYPEDWMKHYKQNSYHNFDPVFHRILLKPGAFFWSDAISSLERDSRFTSSLLDRSRSLMQEAADAGLADGIAVSIPNEWGEIAGIGISRPQRETDLDVRALADIQLLSAVLHERYMGCYRSWSPAPLTNREKEVLSWSAEGKSDWEIAEIIGISRATIRFHWNNIFKKLAVNNKTTATVHAIRRKLVVPDALRPFNPL
ncbi:LuxR family transcriptional regulator [Roseibium marinum]|uniref:LuxR family quorum sensing-dependent transcriptional regulator/LuxR family quorum-sensing system transcriptional regulator CciR n=1 Tax=Roseibium marinum TaxID=281252 RepID=A0A2S3UMH8_9HYPH|nr:LuxR family transcriptional regulator [Roseibium marinum]POF28928.1 LuxR family quorum sensing-dependent transcriptional regulator/LuxR family quorum-sensing system transcriptional regulator CciR [Roseibium marinum]